MGLPCNNAGTRHYVSINRLVDFFHICNIDKVSVLSIISEWKLCCDHKLEEKALIEVLELLKTIELHRFRDKNLRVNELESLQSKNLDIVINI